MSSEIASIREASRLIPVAQRADFFGVLCSAGCALHCAATPLAMSILPTVSALHVLENPVLHQVAAVICGVFATRAILPSWREHKSLGLVLLAVAGLALLCIDAFHLANCCTPRLTEITLPEAGGGSLASSGGHQILEASAGSNRAAVVAPRNLNGSTSALDWLNLMQPYLSFLGGTLLILAHIWNIRLNCCSSKRRYNSPCSASSTAHAGELASSR